MAVTQQGHRFLDPENCGSSVGYYLHINEYTPKDKKPTYSLEATVVLTDCTHKIDWGFSGEDSVDKIDEAIKTFQEFKKKYVEMAKHVKQLNK